MEALAYFVLGYRRDVFDAAVRGVEDSFADLIAEHIIGYARAKALQPGGCAEVSEKRGGTEPDSGRFQAGTGHGSGFRALEGRRSENR